MNTKQLRQKILDLAIKGKLVPQDPNDEPASKLLERIREEKERLINEGKLKRDKNESYIFVGDDKLHYEKFADGSVVCIEDEIPFEVPESWAWVRGKEIFKGLSSTKPSGDFFKYIDIDAIDNKLHVVKAPKKIATKNAPSRASRYLEYGDTIFSMVRPYLENIAYISEELQNCIASTGFYVCSPYQNLHPEFIYHLMLSKYVINGLNFFMKGDNSPSINASDIENFLYPIPPINEQQRITQTIKELLSIVETLENNKVNLSELIKQTKSKVLDLAIKGKLVPQDPNDEPADKLLERIREEKEKLIKEGRLKRDKNETCIFKNSDDNSYYEQIDGEFVCIDDDLPFEIPENWRWCRIDYYTKTISAGGDKPAIVSKTKTDTCPIPIYSNGLTNKGLYGYTNKATITEPSITISARGTIGYNCIRFLHYYPIVRLISIIPFGGLGNIEYLSYILRYLFPIGSGSSIPQLTVPEVEPIFIPIPPLEEQNRIVEKIKSIFTQLDIVQEIFLQ